MHNLDRTTLEIAEETPNFEFPADYETAATDSPFNEVEEEELAAELLEITEEAELDQFIGGLIRKVARAARAAIKTPLGRQLGGFIKGAIKKGLPTVGGAIGGALVPGAGRAIGSRLGTAVGQIFGLELENLSADEMEFEVAKRLVRLAGTAVQQAATAPADTPDPQGVAKAAVIAAAKTHAPGLVGGAAAGGDTAQGGRATSGRWYRRSGRIIVVGV